MISSSDQNQIFNTVVHLFAVHMVNKFSIFERSA